MNDLGICKRAAIESAALERAQGQDEGRELADLQQFAAGC